MMRCNLCFFAMLISMVPSIMFAEGTVSSVTENLANSNSAVSGTPISQIAPAPSGNRYDILSKMITPMAGVLLGGTQSTARGMTFKATVDQVAGRLPQIIKGASFTVRIQYPDKVRLEAPLLGETIVVCRNGNNVWATPGSKIQFLLGEFHHKPPQRPMNGSPLQIPFTAQQAVLLPALFQLERSSEVAEIGGVPCRIISGGLMSEIAKAAKCEDFSAKLWICADFTPKRIDIRRSDFAMSFLIGELSYVPGFPSSIWKPEPGVTDVYRCDSSQLEQLLYVVMNSLQMTAQDKPWLHEATESQGQIGPNGFSPRQLPPGPLN
jgi:hypothetical protein